MTRVLLVCFFSLLSTVAPLRAFADTSPLTYSVEKFRVNAPAIVAKNISIQTVTVRSGGELDRPTIASINGQLLLAAKRFERDARECSKVEHSGPWEYDLRLEKITYSREYISFVFQKFAVCANSPIIAKEAVVVRRRGGQGVGAQNLVKANLGLASPTMNEQGYLHLEGDAIERLLVDSKGANRGYDPECEDFLRRTYFSAWVDNSRLIFFPEFVQPSSFCQQEYSILIAK